MKRKIKIRKQLTIVFGLFSLIISLLIALLLDFAVGKSFDKYINVKNQQLIMQMVNNEDSNDLTSTTTPRMMGGNGTMIHTVNNLGRIYQLNSVEQELRNSINNYIIIIGIFSFFVAIILGYIISRMISRPLIYLQEVTKEIENGNYEIEIKKNTSIKEISNLIIALEKMANRVNENIEHDKRLSQDVQHELRTPLTNLKVQVEAMIDGIWELNKENLNLCLSEIERLNGIINQLYQLGQIENDENLSVTSFNVKLMIDILKKEHSLMLEKNNMSLINNIEDYIEVNNDENIIKSAINNMISNAIRYSGQNTQIQVSYENFNSNDESSPYYKIIKEQLDVQNDYHIIAVSDNGKGIEKEQLEKIFDRFYRVDKSRSRNLGGSGLGLSIVYASAKKLNGIVSVSSEENVETKFSFIFKK